LTPHPPAKQDALQVTAGPALTLTRLQSGVQPERDALSKYQGLCTAAPSVIE